MGVIKKLGAICFTFFVASFAFSENVVFTCIENTDAFENASQITVKIEDYIFDSLFNVGFIASNVPASKNNADVTENINAVNNALENKVDYIIIVNLDYASTACIDTRTNEKFAHLNKITYSLFNVADNKIVYTKHANLGNTKTKKELIEKIEKINKNMMKAVTKKMD